MSFFKIAVFFITVIFPRFAFSAELPPELEPDYQRAVIAFNSQKYDESLSLLSAILGKVPDADSALELKALNQKAKQLDGEAVKTYELLLKNSSPSQKAKYQFEIASLHYRSKRYAQARPLFNASIKNGFNVGASHYFLGMIDYGDKQFWAAESHFRETLEGRTEELKPLAHLYLGIIYYQQAHAMGAIRNLKAARKEAKQWEDSPDTSLSESGTEIILTTKKLYKNLDQAKWFGNFSLLFQYDSNVTLLPDSVVAGQLVDGKHTFKNIGTGGVGYASSPADWLQVVTSYRAYFNWNYNVSAKNYDFFSHMPSLYLNYKPYEKFVPGLKAEGNYTFQNVGGTQTLFEYFPYSLTGDIGGYGRYEINPHAFVELDGSYRPKKYYTDPPSGDDQRSGSGYLFRLLGEYSTSSRYLSPSGYVSYEKDQTLGRNWISSTWGFGAANLMKLDDTSTLTASVDILFPHFEQRIPVREDQTFSTRLLFAHQLTRALALLFDVNYVKNNSTLDSIFAYNRFFGGFGINYSF